MATVSDTFKIELKSKLSLIDIVSEFTSLQKRGSNIVGCCPFHKEKTPSFYVYESEGHYHCYGCKAHGDAFDILMDKRGYSFIEAMDFLCQKVGMKMPQLKGPEEIAIEGRYHDLMSFVAGYYHRQLFGPVGQEALAYLGEERGLDQETIKHFNLGYAPCDNRLEKELLRHDFSLEDAYELKVLLPGRGAGTFNQFAGRVIFPIHNYAGHIVGFGGRVLRASQDKVKYINTGETPLFHKSQILYNANRLRQNRHAQDPVLCVEGYMDVVGLHQAGYSRAVGVLGTAFNGGHLNTLWKLVSPKYPFAPILCFDGDEAGYRSAKRALESILPDLNPEQSLNFLLLEDGLDPDDFVQKRGVDSLRQAVQRSKTPFNFFYESVMGGALSLDPGQRAQLKKNAHKLIDQMVDKTLAGEWRRSLNRRAYEEWKISQESPYKYKKGVQAVANFGAAQRTQSSQLYAFEVEVARHVLGWFQKYPGLCDYIQEEELAPVITDEKLLHEFHLVFDQFYTHDATKDEAHCVNLDQAVATLKELLGQFNAYLTSKRIIKMSDEDYLLYKTEDPRGHSIIRREINALMEQLEKSLRFSEN